MYKALRVAGGSARYARSQGRMEHNNRCSRWSNSFRYKQATCKCQELHAPGKQPDAACMLYVHTSFDMYSDRHVFGLLLGARVIALWIAVLAVLQLKILDTLKTT